MTPQVKRILDEVNKLTPYERAEIIDLILDSFDNPVDKKHVDNHIIKAVLRESVREGIEVKNVKQLV